MQTKEKNRVQKEVEPAIRRLNVLTRLLNKDPEILTAIEKFFGKRGVMVVSQEAEKNDITPQIAVIGKTGVGKSSTLNKLFNPQPNLPVDHVEPATLEILKLPLGERGELIVIDSPGLGVGEESDKRIMFAFKEILAESDVAVWIIKADDRALGIDQSFVTQVLPENLRNRLVVGINQIDKIQPGEWSQKYNLPSKEQEESIKRKEEVVFKGFKSVGVEPISIVSYSAFRNYRLTKLFTSMIDACPPERISALLKRGDINSYLSPHLRKELQK